MVVVCHNYFNYLIIVLINYKFIKIGILEKSPSQKNEPVSCGGSRRGLSQMLKYLWWWWWCDGGGGVVVV